MAKKRTRRNFRSGGIRHRGGSWQIMWREHGQRHYETYTDEDKARRVLARVLGDIEAGRGGLARIRKTRPSWQSWRRPGLNGDKRRIGHGSTTSQDGLCTLHLTSGPCGPAR